MLFQKKMPTVADKIQSELEDTLLEIFALEKNIEWDKAQLGFRLKRKASLEKQYKNLQLSKKDRGMVTNESQGNIPPESSGASVGIAFPFLESIGVRGFSRRIDY